MTKASEVAESRQFGKYLRCASSTFHFGVPRVFGVVWAAGLLASAGGGREVGSRPVGLKWAIVDAMGESHITRTMR